MNIARGYAFCSEGADAERSIPAGTSGPTRMNNLHKLSGGQVILDIVGNLVANVRQFQQFLLDQRVVSFFGQFSVFSGFVSKIVIPVHARPPENSSWLEQRKPTIVSWTIKFDRVEACDCVPDYPSRR